MAIRSNTNGHESIQFGRSAARGVTAVGVATAALLLGVPEGGAAPGAVKGKDEHCILKVVDKLESGELLTKDLGCFGTLEDALTAAGVTSYPGLKLSDRLAGDVAVAASRAIGTHWEDPYRSGDSITVTGDECTGGYVNLTADWSNRISSTANYCPYVRFFDGYDKTGPLPSQETYTSTVNLGAQNNVSNSIQYASS